MKSSDRSPGYCRLEALSPWNPNKIHLPVTTATLTPFSAWLWREVGAFNTLCANPIVTARSKISRSSLDWNAPCRLPMHQLIKRKKKEKKKRRKEKGGKRKRNKKRKDKCKYLIQVSVFWNQKRNKTTCRLCGERSLLLRTQKLRSLLLQTCHRLSLLELGVDHNIAMRISLTTKNPAFLTA